MYNVTANGYMYSETQGWRLQARYLLALGRYEEAANAASRSIALSRNQEVPPGYWLSEPAQTYRAEAYNQLEKYQLAVDDASAALKIHDFSYRARQARAVAYEHLGLTSEAKKDEHVLFHDRRNRTGEDI